MIKIDGKNLSVRGNTVDLLTELTVIMSSFYEKGIADKKDLLETVDMATASDRELTDMLVKILRGGR